MSENNKSRMAMARNALYPISGSRVFEDDIIDLITNLLHLALAEGLDTAAILRMATNHLEGER